MAVKQTIKLELSPEGCAKAIRQLESYKRALPRRNLALCKNLAILGTTIAEQALKDDFRPARYDFETSDPSTVSFGVSKGKSGLTASCEMTATGEDLLFIEFGAGVHFNGNPHGSPHSKGKELGYTIGDYGKGLGTRQWWKWWEGNGWHYSEGTEAVMPVLKAFEKLKTNPNYVRAAATLAWNDGKLGGDSTV